MSMSRRDYNRMAQMLRNRRAQLAIMKADAAIPEQKKIEAQAEGLNWIENEMIELFSEDNPNFKPELFRKAAAFRSQS